MTATNGSGHWAERLPEIHLPGCRPLARLAEIEAEIAGLRRALEEKERARGEQETRLEEWAARNWTAGEIAAAKRSAAGGQP